MRLAFNRSSCGSVLVIALLTIAVITLTLASFVSLLSNENVMVARSQAWNEAVPVMEAGVEEALTQINYCGYLNLSSNNWTLGGDGWYHKTRSVGNKGSYCDAAIQPANPPVVISTAFVRVPLSSSNFISRKVQVKTRSLGGQGGLVASGLINLSGGAIFDSFNSASGPYVTGVHRTNALALTTSTAAGAISLSGGAIYGMGATGFGGTITTSGSAAVGETAWIAAGNTGVEPHYSTNNASYQFVSESAPYTSGATPVSGPGGNGTNYTYVLDGNFNSAYYVAGNFAVNGGQSMIVTGPTTFYVTGSFTVSGSGFVYLAPGASLNLYVGGNSASVSGGGIVNGTQLASKLAIHALPTCTTVTYSGSAQFIGTVNAPQASFTFSGGAGACGGFVAKTITISGSGGVHYDEALGNSGYTVANWSEL